MKRKRNLHVVPHGSGWAVRRQGAQRVSSTHSTQREAITRGRGISRREKGELFIHRPDGRIRARDSHGNDPFPPRG